MSTTQSAAAQSSSAGSSSATLRILIADKFDAGGIRLLESLGCAVESNPDLTPETLGAAIQAFAPDLLIVRSTKVPADVINNAGPLALIIRAGAGYDTIDVAAASARGVFVANCPGKNAIAVAELAWGLILSCDRRIPDQTRDLRAGVWAKKEYAKARGLYGRSLGVVGLGRIGQAVAARGRAFGMNVIGWSRSLTEDKAAAMGVTYCASLVNLAKMSDVVTVHVAATADTANLIDEQFISNMHDGAYLINTSRGSVVDSAALATAVKERKVRAGLDVFANEPGSGDKSFTDEIVNLDGVFGTHHVGASTDQAQEAIASEAVRIVERYLRTGEVPNCVNRAAATPATVLLTVRHLNRPGVLAAIFETLGREQLNVEEMENMIYEGGAAACARIQLDTPPTDEALVSIQNAPNVLSAGIKHLA